MKDLFRRKNPSRIKLEEFISNASQTLPSNSRILDAGSGEGMYRRFFSEKEYISIDLCKVTKAYGKLSAISDLAMIPVLKNSFDVILCSQVLEHVNDPIIVLSELSRVLSPEGELWLSAPFFYEQHEIPFDYFRYTQYGLTHILEKAGFHINKIGWLEGYTGSLAYQMSTAAYYYSKIRRNILFFLIFKIFEYYFNSIESRSGPVEDLAPRLYGKNLIVIATKFPTKIP